MIEIAGERAGYPPEMLDLDANLEADLGIDSIKRVEIIAAVRRAALPALLLVAGAGMARSVLTAGAGWSQARLEPRVQQRVEM